MTIKDYRNNFAETLNYSITEGTDWYYDADNDILKKPLPVDIVHALGRANHDFRTFYRESSEGDVFSLTLEGNAYTITNDAGCFIIRYRG